MDATQSIRVDAANARVSFSVRWFGVLVVRGAFDSVRGSVTVPGDEGADASLSMRVDGASVRTGIGLRDRHLRGPRFLDSGRHPVIGFDDARVSRDNGNWRVRGTLSLRGRQRPVDLLVPDESAAGGPLVAEFSVPRRAHDIGTAHGLRRLNPLLWAIAADVRIRVALTVPATLLQPPLAHAPAR